MSRTLDGTYWAFPAMVEASPPDEPAPPRTDARRSDGESSFDLLIRAQAGDKTALNDLCARYLPRLQRWAHGRLPSGIRSSLDTHDLVQDTLMHVVQRLHVFEPRHSGALQGYMHQALRNRMLDEIRRVARRPSEPLDSAQPTNESSPLELAIGAAALERYEAALARLRPEDREAIVLRVEMGCPYSEVAELLGKPSIAATHMAVSRALARLAKEMSHERRA
ncbi:MAG: RNA polymerase sigma factor [Acidobacteriota bacterium]